MSFLVLVRYLVCGRGVYGAAIEARRAFHTERRDGAATLDPVRPATITGST
jgi:hypothetical protein